jgi:hypothetical protein
MKSGQQSGMGDFYGKRAAQEAGSWKDILAGAGQLAGALLKGRQYDDKTGKQVKKPAAKPMTGMAKPVKKTAAKKK